MNIIAWALQVLLAVVFLIHGVMYFFSPEVLISRMRARDRWPPAIPAWLRLFIGIAELFAAVGLIGPALFRVLPWLTPLASLGLVVVMASAIVYHARRRESVVPTVILLLLAVAVTYLRWQVVPIT